MVQNWTAVSERERGRYIRWVLGDIAGRAPANQNANDRTGIGYWNMAANEHPSAAQFRVFKNLLLVSYREYLDNLFSSFKGTVTDLAIGQLAGDNPALTAPNAGAFLEVAGTAAYAGAAQETGDAHREFIRTLNEKAIRTPDDYVKEANAALTQIDNDSRTVYDTSMKVYFDKYKYPREIAHKMAMEDKKKYANMLTQQHEMVYKASNYEKASGKIYKNA